MSEEAELWLGSVDRKFDDGPGTPAICVQWADCSHCKVKAGQLCRGAHGPTLSHHCDRASEYMALRRAGKVPWGKGSVHHRLKALEARVAVLEALLQKSPRPRAFRKGKD